MKIKYFHETVPHASIFLNLVYFSIIMMIIFITIAFLPLGILISFRIRTITLIDFLYKGVNLLRTINDRIVF